MTKTKVETVEDLIECLNNFNRKRNILIDTNTHGLMPIIGIKLYGNSLYLLTEKIEDND